MAIHPCLTAPQYDQLPYLDFKNRARTSKNNMFGAPNAISELGRQARHVIPRRAVHCGGLAVSLNCCWCGPGPGSGTKNGTATLIYASQSTPVKKCSTYRRLQRKEFSVLARFPKPSQSTRSNASTTNYDDQESCIPRKKAQVESLHNNLWRSVFLRRRSGVEQPLFGCKTSGPFVRGWICWSDVEFIDDRDLEDVHLQSGVKVKWCKRFKRDHGLTFGVTTN